MARLPGIVMVEISIENDVLKKVRLARNWVKRGELPRAERIGLKQASDELKRLIRLEYREPGKGKFIEAREAEQAMPNIVAALGFIKRGRLIPSRKEIKTLLDDAIKDIKILERMELRLG